MNRLFLTIIIAIIAIESQGQTWMTNNTSWTCALSSCSSTTLGYASWTVDNDTTPVHKWVGNWVIYTFPTAVTLTDFRVYVDVVTGGGPAKEFQYWTGQAWVTATSMSLPATSGRKWVQFPTFPAVTNTTWKLVGPIVLWEVGFGVGCVASYSTQSVTACSNWLSPTGVLHTQSGTYSDTIANSCGGDSVVTTNLTVNTVDVSVTLVGTVLTSNASDAAVGWYECPAMTYVGSGQSYNATWNGDYACVVYQNGCWDTSACYNVVVTGLLDNYSLQPNTLFPNPTSGEVSIPGLPGDAEVSVYNSIGVEVARKCGNDSSLVIPGAAGIYLVVVRHHGQTSTVKVVKE